MIVSEKPWKDLSAVISAEKPDLFIVEWKDGQISCGIPISDVLSHSLCNVAIIRGSKQVKMEKTLIAVRGGPHAELALSVGIGLNPVKLDVLHLSLKGNVNDAPFKGLKHILKQIPEVNLRSIVTDDSSKTIFEESNQYDLVVLGVTASKSLGSSLHGPVAEKLLRDSTATVMVVKTHRTISEGMFDETAGVQAISILVDKWFAENTFHADEFANLKQLIGLKKSKDRSSVWHYLH